MWVPPNRGYLVDSPTLRGVGPAGLALRPGFRIVSGRMYRAGRHELVLGLTGARGYGLKVGDEVMLADGKWPIVGTFTAAGSLLVGDAETILMANRISGYGSVLAQLESPAAFEPFKQWLLSNPTLGVSAERQTDYYLRTASRFVEFFTRIAYVIGGVMALGALFGSVKIMYAAVSARTRELATLRAMGYAPLPLALAVLLETLLLALIGAAVGACAAWLLFSGRMIANFQNVFETTVSPALLVLGLAWAAGLALMSALFPAIRTARLPVVDALRGA
jgi:putative ABC transport system permease protein